MIVIIIQVEVHYWVKQNWMFLTQVKYCILFARMFIKVGLFEGQSCI